MVLLMVIVYEDLGSGDANIKVYRNDVKIGDYNKGYIQTWMAGNTEVLFGARHIFPGPGYLVVGELDAKILEAKIYNGALTTEEIGNMPPEGASDPITYLVPINNWAVYLGILLIGVFMVFSIRRRLIA